MMWPTKRFHPSAGKQSSRAGFNLVEVLLAVTLFGMIATAIIGAIIYSTQSAVLAGQRGRAALLMEEGLEAMRSIRDRDYTGLADGTYGLAIVGGQWVLVANPDTTNGFTRTIVVTTQSETSKQIIVTVNWQQSAQRNGSIGQAEVLTDWRPRHKAHGKVGGMLVYGNGGTTSDTISYRVMAPNGTWNGPYTTPDVDPGTGNRAVRAVRVYASPFKTRDEEVMLSEHYDGTKEYIYGMTYNNYSHLWTNVILLASWTTATFVPLESFSGDYLDNGDFMAVYSDGSATPKFRIWNGSGWGSQLSLNAGSDAPMSITAIPRPTTNEVMVATLNRDLKTQTQYFNGGNYQTSSWSAPVTQSSVADANSDQLVDFVWDQNDYTKGELVFVNPLDPKSMALRLWTADGSGGGNWGATVTTPSQSKNLTAVAVDSTVSQDTFEACNKDKSFLVTCFTADITPSVHAPTRSNLTSSTDAGTQRSFHLGFETLFGNTAIAVYSDGGQQINVKRYYTDGDNWDGTAIHLGTVGTSNKSLLKTVRVIPDPDSLDEMILSGVDNNDNSKKQVTEFFSGVWNGTDNQFYTVSPTGKTFQLQGTNGSNPGEFWYDFVWDPNYNN